MSSNDHDQQDFRGITRRAFAGGLMIAAATGLGACAPTQDSAGEKDSGDTMQPGTYVATKTGFAGENTVYVTVDETSIISVEVGKSTDKPTYLTQYPLEIIPQRIVDAQSTSVDVVSGATLTSMSIMNAAKDCIEQAGGKGLLDSAPASPEKALGKTVETDVLVIGGGIAGCMAALSAKQADFDLRDSGLSVIMIEKLGFIGGSLPLAVGGLFTSSPLSAAPKQSYINSEIARMQMMNVGEVNVPLLTNLMNVAGDTTLKMQQLGAPLQTSGIDSESKDSIVKGFNSDAFVAFPLGSTAETSWGGGRYILDAFNVQFSNLGLDIRTNTGATELIIENNAVVGARVEDSESTYDIRAEKVILACGGFAQNQEMIDQYAPHDTKSLAWANGGADGDGIRMGIEAGGRIVGDGHLWGYPAPDSVHGIHNGAASSVRTTGFMVNKDGQEFCDCAAGNSLAYSYIANQPDNEVFSIIDADSPFVEGLEDGLASGTYTEYVFKAETLNDLAQSCGIDATNLAATIEAQNEYLKTRGEVAFGESDLIENPQYTAATPIANSPFYAVRHVQVHLGSCVGLVVDEDCRVLDEADVPIENLYATGECCIGGNIFDFHVGGWGIGGACYSGRIAGEDAKAAILG